MSEYIEREKLIEDIKNDCCELVYYTKADAIDCIKSAHAADVAPVVHGKRIKSRKHRWKTYENGDIDICAWGEDYCNGPICIDCGEHFCVHCVDRKGGEEAVKQRLEEETCEEKTLCSICGRVVPLDAPYCNCGAKMEE